MAPATLPPPTGQIRIDVSYDLQTFKRTAGLSDWAMRQARRNGLRLRKVGRKVFVRGSDWDAYLQSVEA
jgi:hypothetical protein